MGWALFWILHGPFQDLQNPLPLMLGRLLKNFRFAEVNVTHSLKCALWGSNQRHLGFQIQTLPLIH